MSSLWTPEGEHRVPYEAGPAPETPVPGLAEDEGGEGPELSDEEMRRLARELAATPVADIVANHCYGLFELAALHLSAKPPNLEAARMVIDSMGYLVEGLGNRLGRHESSLAEGLTQLRLAFVRIADVTGAPEGDGAAGQPADGG